MKNASLIKVLLIEDDEDDVLLAREYLSEVENYRFEVEWEPQPERAREKMVHGKYNIFLIDYRLGSENGLDLIKFAQSNGVITPCILLTGQGDLNVDLDASRFGAADYLVKTELNASTLERSIRYALSQADVIRELDEKEKKYRSLFERSVDPIFLTNDSLKLMDVNDAFLSFFRYTAEEVMNLTLRQLFTDNQDYLHFQDTLKNVEQIRDFEATLINRDGEKKVCMINCVYIPDLASQFCCYQGIIHDQTLRKKAERDMLIAERLSMTGKIARTIAHEVRNPLTNLTLALEQLKEEMPAKNENINLYTGIIERNANRIEQLIGEMLSSSKPKELNLQLAHLHEIMDDTIALAIDRMNLNQIRLERSFAEGLPRVLVDQEKIKIAFLNIMVNAIEAMKPGEGVLNVALSRNGNVILAAITDNGKGIAQEDVEKLFDPFFTDKQGGMGLGLTSTKNILNSHNAEVEVTSKLNEGTSFVITFRLPEF